MVLVPVALAVIRTAQKKVKGAEVNLIQKRDMAIIPIKNPRVAKASPILMVKATMVPRVLTGTRNPKAAAANLIHMEKVTIVPKGVIVIATRNPKAVVVNSTHMVKAAMATRAVMENLMATKKHQPIEVMEDMDRVLLNMSCIISTN